MNRAWSRNELLIAMNLYCKLPFGQCNSRNKLVNEVSKNLKRSPGAISMKLGNLASLDPYQRNRGVVGLKSVSNLDRQIWQQFQDDWARMAERSEEAFNILMNSAPLHEDEEEFKYPEGASQVDRFVKTRRLQNFFRNAVLSSYNHRCALSGITIDRLLNASHIIPWSKSESRRADPTNGICLNVLYDRAFDRGLITFDEDYRLVLSSDLKAGNVPDLQRDNFINKEGDTLWLPHRFLPDHNALEYHRNNLFVA